MKWLILYQLGREKAVENLHKEKGYHMNAGVCERWTGWGDQGFNHKACSEEEGDWLEQIYRSWVKNNLFKLY